MWFKLEIFQIICPKLFMYPSSLCNLLFQVVGGGRCLVFWRPETAEPHRVDIKFNGEPVPSSPFVFHVAPAQRVTIDTAQIGLFVFIIFGGTKEVVPTYFIN